MNSVIQEVWFWLIATWFILEVISIIIYKESWMIISVAKLIDIIQHTIVEISSKKGREALCGMLIMLCIFFIIALLVHCFSAAVTSSDATTVIAKSAVVGIIILGVTIVAACANRRYIVQR